MKKEYDLNKMKGRKNPYANRLKKQITIRLDSTTIEYFKNLANETGFSYQMLINFYLKDCADNHKKLKVQWIEPHS
jgi:predicted DNA binding CopG/RHH family protein